MEEEEEQMASVHESSLSCDHQVNHPSVKICDVRRLETYVPFSSNKE